METLQFLQLYWWAVVSLLGALLVFLLFVQGGQTLIFSTASSDEERNLLIGALGHKWELTFTTLVTFGGASSHDIQDGILNLDEEERIYEYRKRGAYFRIRDFSWWDLELPTKEEMENGIKNLEKVNYKVDYIISHCCPTSIQTLINPTYEKDLLTDYLQQISEKCTFKKWYFGHYHVDIHLNEDFTCLFNTFEELI